MLDKVGLGARLDHYPGHSPVASSSGWRSPAPWCTPLQGGAGRRADRQSSMATGRTSASCCCTLNAETNTTLVLVTHDMPGFAARCDRLLRFADGRLSETRRPRARRCATCLACLARLRGGGRTLGCSAPASPWRGPDRGQRRPLPAGQREPAGRHLGALRRRPEVCGPPPTTRSNGCCGRAARFAPDRVPHHADHRQQARRSWSSCKASMAPIPCNGTLRFRARARFAEATAERDGRHGVVLDRVLAERTGRETGGPDRASAMRAWRCAP